MKLRLALFALISPVVFGAAAEEPKPTLPDLLSVPAADMKLITERTAKRGEIIRKAVSIDTRGRSLALKAAELTGELKALESRRAKIAARLTATRASVVEIQKKDAAIKPDDVAGRIAITREMASVTTLAKRDEEDKADLEAAFAEVQKKQDALLLLQKELDSERKELDATMASERKADAEKLNAELEAIKKAMKKAGAEQAKSPGMKVTHVPEDRVNGIQAHDVYVPVDDDAKTEKKEAKKMDLILPKTDGVNR